MESQRQMMEGGYGHPDGEGNSDPGVTNEAKSKWENFFFRTEDKNNKGMTKGKYGSVTTTINDDLQDLKKPSAGNVFTPSVDDEEPHCAICLGEYEENEKLVRLPCGHTYHEECINSWCTNHTRCPLCNYDLNSVVPSAQVPFSLTRAENSE